MYPTLNHELARIKIADELAYAERQRLARGASRGQNRPIDFHALVGQVRIRLLGWRAGPPSHPVPTGA